ncbi:MAG: hypothetical protein ACLS36_02475 [Streptococcus sp.]
MRKPGRAIKASGIPREDIFRLKGLISQLLRRYQISPKNTSQIDTDYLDLYLIHQPLATYMVPGVL